MFFFIKIVLTDTPQKDYGMQWGSDSFNRTEKRKTLGWEERGECRMNDQVERTASETGLR